MNRYQWLLAISTAVIVGVGLIADVVLHVGWWALLQLVPLAVGILATCDLRDRPNA